jgi:hypothetical protein
MILLTACLLMQINILLILSQGQTRCEAGTQSHGSRLLDRQTAEIFSGGFLFNR